VGLGVVDQDALLGRDSAGVFEIIGDLFIGIILEELRIGPVHLSLGEELLSELPGASQPLQEEEGVGEVFSDLTDDIAPDGQGDHIAGVEPEAVDAAAAPG